MRTIRGRITIVGCGMLTLTIIVLTIGNLFYFSNKLQSAQETKMIADCDLHASEINNTGENCITVLKAMALTLGSAAIVDEDTVRAVVEVVWSQYPEFLNVYFASTSGFFIRANEINPLPDDYDPRNRDWYKQAVSNVGVAIVDPYRAASKDVMCTTASIPVYKDNVFLGVLGIDITVESVTNLINSVNYTEGAYGVLLDSNFNIISHPDESLLPTETSRVNALEKNPSLENTIKNADEKVIIAENYKGEKCFYACTSIPVSGWYFLVVVPTSIILDDVNAALLYSIIIALLAIAVSLFICLVLVKREFDPIKRMVPEVSKLSEGDFSAELDFSIRHDEFADLQSALSKMTDTMNKIISEQQLVLGEIAMGNLTIHDMSEFPGDFNEISQSVNSIKATLNALISEIQFSAITLQSTAMGFTMGEASKEEMEAIFKELSAEAEELMEKANKFTTYAE